MAIDIEPTGKFATALKAELDKRGMSVIDAGVMFDTVQENIRKYLNNDTHPSKPRLRVMTQKLKVNYEDWLLLMEQDKAAKKFPNFENLVGVGKELKPFAAVIPRLNEQSRGILLDMAKSLLKKQTA